ncbi:MAG: hypothetical protein Q8P67_00665 [archaeon]|nr:hypothetical protein [archaeon]
MAGALRRSMHITRQNFSAISRGAPQHPGGPELDQRTSDLSTKKYPRTINQEGEKKKGVSYP